MKEKNRINPEKLFYGKYWLDISRKLLLLLPKSKQTESNDKRDDTEADFCLGAIGDICANTDCVVAPYSPVRHGGR